MKHLAMVLAVGTPLATLGTLCDAAPTGATLTGPNESPPNASPGTGATVVTLDTVAHTLQVSVNFTGLTAPTTMSHIHCCVAPNGTAGVATTTPTFAGFPLGVTAGVYNATLNTTLASSWNPAYITANGGTPLSAEAALAAGIAAGQAYLNVHTSAFPAGEIRGFLVALPPSVAFNVPTTSEFALGLMAVAVAVTGFVVMRKRRSTV